MKYLSPLILCFLIGFLGKADAGTKITLNKEVKSCLQSKVVCLQEILKRDSKISPEMRGFIIGAIVSYQDVLQLLEKKDIKFADYNPIGYDQLEDYTPDD